jgi:hypothetical protein
MERKSLDEVRGVAAVLPNWVQPRPLSRFERLHCWAEALERAGGRRLKTLFEIEHAPYGQRAALRADGSPLSIAFDEPRLRAEGLAGDTVGDATAFFGISEMELHAILCFCHHGETMSAEEAAMRVRRAAAGLGREPRPAATTFVGAIAAVSISVALLV